MKILHLALALSFATVNTDAWAQAPQQVPPKTKIEAFTGETGAVLIKGYVDLGTINERGRIDVTAMIFQNATTGQQSKGIVLEVTEAGYIRSAPLRSARSYIDHDEIGGLLDGIDYIGRTNASVTPYPFFEAKYSTRGEFNVTVFNNDSNKRSVSITAGRIGSQSAFLQIESLPKLRDLIVKAKNVLENPDLARESVVPKAEARASDAAPVSTPPSPVPQSVAPKPPIRRTPPSSSQPLTLAPSR